MKIKPMVMLLTMVAGWMNRQQQEIIEYLKAENVILRDELQKATGKKRIILNDKQRRRLAILGRKVGRGVLSKVCCAFSPDTILLWHCKLVAHKYNGSKNRGKGGRPRISDYLRQLIIYMAKNNKHLGGKTLHGYLKYLGIKVSPSTINRILREHGIEPCPDRPERTTWNEFIRREWDSLAAIDFFQKEIWTIKGLVKCMVLVVIDYKTRKVEIAGIIPQAHGGWMKQIARNLTDPIDGFLKDKKYLIHDQDPLFTEAFKEILKAGGITCKKTSVASPNMTPFVERFIRSIKHECLNKMLIFGEKHLKYCVSEYMEHYHTERPHQGIGNN
ncbi:MAG: integrase core domain-containing protein, partial [Planctomycetes bacterium]|nr:integrase core domain-containing protein [Planctomycetota bacterium]